MKTLMTASIVLSLLGLTNIRAASLTNPISCSKLFSLTSKELKQAQLLADFEHIYDTISYGEKKTLFRKLARTMGRSTRIEVGYIDPRSFEYKTHSISREDVKTLAKGRSILIDDPKRKPFQLSLAGALPLFDFFMEGILASQRARWKHEQSIIFQRLDALASFEDPNEKIIAFMRLTSGFVSPTLYVFSLESFRDETVDANSEAWDSIVTRIQDEARGLIAQGEQSTELMPYALFLQRYIDSVLSTIDDRLSTKNTLGESSYTEGATIDIEAEQLEELETRVRSLLRSQAEEVFETLKQRLQTQAAWPEGDFDPILDPQTGFDLLKIRNLSAEEYVEARVWFLGHIKTQTKDIIGLRKKWPLVEYLNQLSMDLNDRKLQAKEVWGYLKPAE